MRWVAVVVMLMALLAGTAYALDVCSDYAGIHEKEIVPRIRSGIPFKLLSVAADERDTFRRIVSIEYDLWSEKISVGVLDGARTTTPLSGAAAAICKALSLPEAPAGRRYQYRLLLNPVLGDGLKRLRERRRSRSGLLEINWERLAKDLETEKTLIQNELGR